MNMTAKESRIAKGEAFERLLFQQYLNTAFGDQSATLNTLEEMKVSQVAVSYPEKGLVGLNHYTPSILGASYGVARQILVNYMQHEMSADELNSAYHMHLIDSDFETIFDSHQYFPQLKQTALFQSIGAVINNDVCQPDRLVDSIQVMNHEIQAYSRLTGNDRHVQAINIGLAVNGATNTLETIGAIPKYESLDSVQQGFQQSPYLVSWVMNNAAAQWMTGGLIAADSDTKENGESAIDGVVFNSQAMPSSLLYSARSSVPAEMHLSAKLGTTFSNSVFEYIDFSAQSIENYTFENCVFIGCRFKYSEMPADDGFYRDNRFFLSDFSFSTLSETSYQAVSDHGWGNVAVGLDDSTIALNTADNVLTSYSPKIGIFGDLFSSPSFDVDSFPSSQPYNFLLANGAIPVVIDEYHSSSFSDSGYELLSPVNSFATTERFLVDENKGQYRVLQNWNEFFENRSSREKAIEDAISQFKEEIADNEPGVSFLFDFLTSTDVKEVLELRALAKTYAKDLDGLWITGQVNNIDPLFYNKPAQDEPKKFSNHQFELFESALALEMLALNKPVYGTCHGMQLMNVLLGGSLHQDYGYHLEAVHPISVSSNSGLVGSQIADTANLFHLSQHSQGVDELGVGLEPVANRFDVLKAAQGIENPIYMTQYHAEDELADNVGDVVRAFINHAKTTHFANEPASTTRIPLNDVIDTHDKLAGYLDAIKERPASWAANHASQLDNQKNATVAKPDLVREVANEITGKLGGDTGAENISPADNGSDSYTLYSLYQSAYDTLFGSNEGVEHAL